VKSSEIFPNFGGFGAWELKDRLHKVAIYTTKGTSTHESRFKAILRQKSDGGVTSRSVIEITKIVFVYALFYVFFRSPSRNLVWGYSVDAIKFNCAKFYFNLVRDFDFVEDRFFVQIS